MDGQIGTLEPGAIADLVVMELTEGEFEMIDAFGVSEIGGLKLEPRFNFRAGQQVGVVPRASP